MPATYVTKNQKLKARFTAWVYGQMKVQHMTQGMVAEKLGISQPSLKRKLRNQNFDMDDIFVFVELFKPDDKEIGGLLRG